MNQWIRKRITAADHMRRSDKEQYTSISGVIYRIVTHAFSSRMGGVSEGWYSTMNFSFTRGDDRNMCWR